MAPRAQLWFEPHLCVCSSYDIFPNMPKHGGRGGGGDGHGTQAHQGSWRWRRLWQKGHISLLRQAPLLVPVEAGTSAWGRGCNGSLTPCAPLNNSALRLWQHGLLSQTFPVVEFLTPIPSGCLFAANSFPFPGSSLQIPCSSTQHLFTLADTQLSLGHSELWHGSSM